MAACFVHAADSEPGENTVPPARVNWVRLVNAAKEPGEWFTGGRDANFTYYSPLTDINTQNVHELGFAWSHDLDTTFGLEATPIVVDGRMYTSAPWGVVVSLDAATGKLLWSFDPKVNRRDTARKACCDVVNRGVAVMDGRVFVASLDGRLFALDAADGHPIWVTDTIIDHERGYTVTGAPYLAGDLVVIGNSGAELDARGYISAYYRDSGRLAWRFFTVPANRNGPFEHPELARAAKTWSEHTRWEVGLGGTAWDGMAYDPQLGLLYVGVGNAALYPRSLRSPGGGDNLFVSSILAIHARTGRLAWSYQETPGDQWDYTATQKIILADLDFGAGPRKVLMQAPKNGFFYILDRETGELISAEPYVPVNWASGVDPETGRPRETEQGDYTNAPRLVFPATVGGHNWQPMAFNPQTGLVYIPALEAGAVFWIPKEPFVYQRGGFNMGSTRAYTALESGEWGLESARARDLPPLSELAKGQPDPTLRGFLRAWDPLRHKVVWQVETSGQWVGRMNALWNGGGVMTTAGGLVFQGRSTGFLHVYAAKDGKELARINVGTGIMAAPMTYAVRGVQYVAVMAGSGGALGKAFPSGSAAARYGNQGRIVAFRLGGGPVPLRPERRNEEAPFPRPAFPRTGTREQVAHGMELFGRHCAQCHANAAAAGIPDLRRMSRETYDQFEAILLEGTRASKGMGSFAHLLSPADVADLRAATSEIAWQTYEADQRRRHSQPGTPDSPGNEGPPH